MGLRNWLRLRRYYWRQFFTADGEFELRILAVYVPPKRVAVDVGANMGTYSFHLSRFARSVVAFEPNPVFHDALRLLPSRVRVIAEALSSSAGSLPLSIPMGEAGEATGWATLEPTSLPVARTIEVPVRRLDDCDLPPVGFIKIDVEGHELDVLIGAEATIRRDQPVLLVECEDAHRSGATGDLFAWAKRMGYSGWFYFEGKRWSVEDFDLTKHQAQVHLTPGQRIRRQELPLVNNFLFQPTGSA